MNVVAIIQARMGSTRLPGKVLLPLAGKPVLDHVVTRIKHCSKVNKIVVATSLDSSDDIIDRWCRDNAVNCYRGSLHDVLDRYYHAAVLNRADIIVRITADCPAIDPTIVDKVVQGFIDGGYECFGLSGEFPDGLDCTVFSFAAIERAWNEALLPSEREHVGPYIEKNPQLFRSGKIEPFSGLGNLRWTLDEPQDLILLQKIFSRLYQENNIFLAEDILALLRREPELSVINASIIRNEGYLKSIQADNESNLHA